VQTEEEDEEEEAKEEEDPGVTMSVAVVEKLTWRSYVRPALYFV